MNKKIFAQRLKVAREQNNLTQKAFAQILGIVDRTYQHYESEIFKVVPSIQMLYKISTNLNTSIDWLVGRTD